MTRDEYREYRAWLRRLEAEDAEERGLYAELETKERQEREVAIDDLLESL